ncbi:MAG: eIF2A-related protein [Gaiellaceae bacterium]
MTTSPSSPFKGLNAFADSELDALLFFGREREREIVVANLIASRLTVLYGPSGVGKSSLLGAAVARSLRELPENPLVVLFSRWSDDPSEALSHAVAEASGGAVNGSPLQALEHAQEGRDVYLVLDQAEEYFLYHADDGGPGSFAEALPGILAAPLRINVLVSLREDSLAKLDRFTGRIPGLFANTLRLDRLDRQAAKAAIVGPIERYAQLTGTAVSVEPELIERVLDEVGAGQIEPALGGLGVVEGAESARIEAPYLQLVMQRLWDEEDGAGSDVLRVETLERLGGAQHIVEEHLEGALSALSSDQKDVAARLFNHLVTPSGTKIAHETSDLADFGQVPFAELQPVLATLSERRILRSLEEGGGVRYEIFHDVLAQPVLAWRASHEAERELQRQRASADRRHRRLLAVIGVGAVLFVAMGGVTAYALSQRTEARQQAREARANELQANADAELGTDPELSLLLALEAARLVPGDRAERAVRDALLASRARGIVDVDEPLLDAVARGSDVLIVAKNGDVLVTDPRTGEAIRTTETGKLARDASFADDGTALVTGSDGQIRVVRPNGEIATIPGAGAARGAAISADATLAAVIGEGGVRLTEVSTGRVRHVYPHRGAESAAISHNNRRVLTGGADSTVRVWSGQSGRRVHTLTEQSGHAVAVAFSPDGAYAASASTDGVGRIWRSGDWGLNTVLTGHTHALTNIAFSADGEHVVTTAKDGTARVSHTETGDELFVMPGHDDWVTSAAFTGDAGSAIVTASPDGTARVWDAVFQPEVDELASLGAPIVAVEVLEDGRVRAATSDGQQHVLDPLTGDELEVEPGQRRRPLRVVGPDGTVATIRGKTVILRRDGRTTILRGHRDRVTSVSFSRFGTLLVTASLDHDVRIWDIASGESVRRFQHNTAAHDAQFSPDGQWVVTAANRAGLWDAQNGANVLRLQGHEGTFTSAAFDPTGRTIVTGGVDGTVRTYDCEVCGSLDRLVELAERRLAATRRELTAGERAQYLG